MIFKGKDFRGTLILRRDTAGNVRADGQTHAELGYSVGQAFVKSSPRPTQDARQFEPSDPSTEGVWATWHWDGRQLVLQNDRFGFFPVYYAELPDGFAVSTSALELLRAGASRQLDDAAIAVFLRLGNYIGDDTPFAAVRVLPPGTTLRWSDGKLSLTSTCSELPRERSSLTRQQAVDSYGKVFQSVVEDMLPDPADRMCVPLSAGRDSRHIVYALARAGRLPQMVLTAESPPPRPSTDAKVAAEITAEMGLPHQVIRQSSDRFADEIEKDLLTCFCADEHAQMLPVARWLQQSNVDVSWDGIAGDIFSCGVYNDSRMLDQFRQGQLGELSEWLLDAEGYMPGYLTPEALKRWNRDLAIQHLSKELGRYADLPNPAAPFFFYNRVRRELALSPYGILNQSTHILAPYLSHRVFDLLINLPFEFFGGRQFHSEAIDQFYPELPQKPYHSTTSGNVNERYSRIWRFANRFGRMALSGSEADSCIQRRFLLPRLAKGMFQRAYGTETPVLFSRVLVMLHLEQTLRLPTFDSLS